VDQLQLHVAMRDLLGKEVRHLRRQGITPLHLYGHGVASVALQCDTRSLQSVLGQAGATGLVQVNVEGEKRPRTAMFREIQVNTRTGQLLHVDLYQVRERERVRVDVPVTLVGEAPALRLKENTLVQELNTISVECLATMIPSNITLDVEALAEPGQAIRVRDIDLGEEITVLNDPDLVVASIQVQRPEEVEVKEELPEEAAEEIEAAPAEERGEEQS